jgi:hypothetical protein
MKIKSKNIKTYSFIIELSHNEDDIEIVDDVTSKLLNPDSKANNLLKNKYVVYTSHLIKNKNLS